MINFIICDDNKNVVEILEKVIHKITMPYDFNYKVYSFNNYNTDLKHLIKKSSDFKIYLLDIEMPSKNGIEIAREIRNNDWDSAILMITSHQELELFVLKQKLLILDFISKFEDYEAKLKDCLKLVLEKISSTKSINFKSGGEHYNLSLDNIIYIYRNNIKDKNVIVTNDNDYEVSESLVSIAKKLNSKFYKTHRACYVNLNHIRKVDFKNNIIYLTNNKQTDYLSRNYKKGLRERI